MMWPHTLSVDQLYLSLFLVFFCMLAIIILSCSVCRSLEKASTLPTCRPRVPTTALPIRTTKWACCFCARWVKKRLKHTKSYWSDQMWVQITLPHRQLTFWGQFTYFGKVMFSSYIRCNNNIDIYIDFIHTLYTVPSEALLFCNCRLLWVTAMSCWTPTTKPTNCLMENTAPRAWARPDPTPETPSPC